MADDQNRSNNKRPMNNIGPTVSKIQELHEISERASADTAEYAQLKARIDRERSAISAIREMPPSAALTEREEYHRERMVDIGGRMRQMNESRRAKSERELSTRIGKHFSESHISGMAQSMSRSSTIQNSAFALSNSPGEELMQRRQDIMEEMSSLRSKTAGSIGSLLNQKGRIIGEGELGAVYGRSHLLTRELAQITAAQSIQSAMGADPASKLKDIVGASKAAQGLLSTEAIAREVQAGGVNISQGGQIKNVSMANIQGEMINQAKALTDALRQLSETTNKTDEELGSLRQQAEESSKNFEKLKEASGMGGGGDRFGRTASGLSSVSGMFGALAAGIYNVGVGQRIQEKGITAGYANIENFKYETYKQAAAGDIASQLMLTQFGGAEKFAGSLKNWAGASVAARAAGGVAQIGAGVAQGASALNPGQAVISTSNAVNAGIAGGQNVVGGAAVTVEAAADAMRGITTGQAYQQGFYAQLDAWKAVSSIRMQQLQGFRNYSVGMGTVAAQMGGRGGDFINATVSDKMLGAMSEARISPEQMIAMSHLGINQMGSMFDTDQVMTARGLERSGMGTMEQNMQRMGRLASAGSNNPRDGLAQVLEAAVGKGFDSSKSMDLLVDYTSQMVKQNATATAAGLNLTGVTATMLGATADPNIKNREFALDRAMTAQQAAQQIMTNTDVSFAGMLNTARISKATGLGGTDAIYAAKLTSAELRDMQQKLKSGDEASVRSALMEKGVNPNNFKGGLTKGVGSLLDASLMTLAEGGGIGLATGTSGQRRNVQNAMKSGDFSKLTEEERVLMGRIGAQHGVTGSEIGRAGAAVNAQNKQGAQDQVTGAMKGDTGSDVLKNLDFMRTQGFKQLSDAAKAATADLGGATKALSGLATLAKDIDKNLGGESGEKDFATSAAKSAASFGEGAKTFQTSAGIFAESVKIFAAVAGNEKGANEVNALLDKLNKDTKKAGTGIGKN
jgi:hypothetical protein